MIIDCNDCAMRGPVACPDCVVTVLAGAPPSPAELDHVEQLAVAALADAGLVPPLRLVPREGCHGDRRSAPRTA
jgi:hypothetical protein